MDDIEVLDTQEKIVAVLSVQSSAIIEFEEDYYVVRIAGEPATDRFVDVDFFVLEQMLLDQVVDRSWHGYGWRYWLKR